MATDRDKESQADQVARGQEAIDFVGDLTRSEKASGPPAPPPPLPPLPPPLPTLPPADEVMKDERGLPREQTENEGCLLKMGFPAAAVGLGLVVLGALVFFATRNSGDSSTKTSNPSQAVPAPAPTQAGGNPSGFAGHYVLSGGLADPKGVDAHNGAYPVDSVGPSSASIDVDDQGKISGGTYHTSADGNGCHYTGDSASATGNVTSAGTGTVSFEITWAYRGEAPCGSASYTAPRPYFLGIAGDDLFLCNQGMASTSTCTEGTPPTAQFHKGG